MSERLEVTDVDRRDVQARARSDWTRSQSVSLYVFTKTHDAVLQFVPAPDAGDVATTVSLSRTSAQQLMDDLWACGVRPAEAEGSAGAMAAVQEHLKDLRKILFEDHRTGAVR